MRSLPRLVFAALLLPVVAPVDSLAQPGGRGMYEGMPFGQSCPGPRGGGPYGARRPVATADQAKKMVKTYFPAREWKYAWERWRKEAGTSRRRYSTRMER